MRNEVIEYSLELAKRMESSLILLLLLRYGTDEIARIENGHSNDLKIYIKDKMINHMEKIHAEGIHVEAELRIGDPSSELLKFLAEIGSIETIIWGGKNNLSNKKEMHKKSHWFLKTRGFVKCPIMFPVKDKMEN
ncbi:MAG: hypothetical protein MUP22_08710 [Desulfobacterales bacterium]|nr:hypothetical protein [Desulfobacterales bacterium]